MGKIYFKVVIISKFKIQGDTFESYVNLNKNDQNYGI